MKLLSARSAGLDRGVYLKVLMIAQLKQRHLGEAHFCCVAIRWYRFADYVNMPHHFTHNVLRNLHRRRPLRRPDRGGRQNGSHYRNYLGGWAKCDANAGD